MQPEWEKGRSEHHFSALFPPLPSQKEKEEKAPSLWTILYSSIRQNRERCARKISLPKTKSHGMACSDCRCCRGFSGNWPLSPLVWGCGLILSTFGQERMNCYCLSFYQHILLFHASLRIAPQQTAKTSLITQKQGSAASLFQQESEIYLPKLISWINLILQKNTHPFHLHQEIWYCSATALNQATSEHWFVDFSGKMKKTNILNLCQSFRGLHTGFTPASLLGCALETECQADTVWDFSDLGKCTVLGKAHSWSAQVQSWKWGLPRLIKCIPQAKP